MEPKRFIGNDLARLYARIRRDLGPDAIVVRTRSLLREGAEPLIEILAAPGDEAALPAELQRAMMQSVLFRVDSGLTVGDIEDMIARESPPPAPEPTFRFEPALAEPSLPAGPSFDETSLLDQVAAELERRSQPALEPLPAVEAPPPARAFRRRRPPAPLDDVRVRLRDAGYPAITAETVVELAPGERDPAKAVGTALQQGSLAYPDEDQTAVLTVQGGQGTGRTTALLRMAFDCAGAGRPAIIVAAATENAADVERVRSFAAACGIPFDLGRDPRAAGNIARRAERGTCVFLDVPAGVWRMALPVGVRHYRYLALPADEPAEELEAIVSPFDFRAFSGAVVTHGDRARTLLPVVDQLLRSGLGAAFVSDGPNPATGIAIADPFMLASGTFTTATGVTTDGRLSAIA